MLRTTIQAGRRPGSNAFLGAAKTTALAMLVIFAVASCQKAPEPPPSSNGATPAPKPTKPATARVPAATPVRTTPRPGPTPPEFAAGSMILSVLIRDYAYMPTPLNLPSGKKITLAITNLGTTPHEFMAGRDLTPEKDGFKTDLFHGIAVQTAQAGQTTTASSAKSGTTTTQILIAPKTTAFMTFTLPDDRKGEWETACFQPGHYVDRLHGILRVE